MKKPLWVVAWLLVVEILIILLLFPGDWTKKAIEKESELVESSLGSEQRYWIKEQAESLYQSVLIDSGFYAAMHYMLIPTDEQRRNSHGMEKMGELWFKWVKGRIDALAIVVYQFMIRLALLMSWAPYMLILLLPAIYDGMMTWRIKKTNFDYASPVIHRYGVRLIAYLMLGLGIAFFAPIALNPIIIPIVMMICCVLMGITIGNLQKRV